MKKIQKENEPNSIANNGSGLSKEAKNILQKKVASGKFSLDDWCKLNSFYFLDSDLKEFKEKLGREITKEDVEILKNVEKQLKNPIVALILSIFTGYIGGDRYYLNEYHVAIVKTLTIGCLLIMYVIDMLSIKERVYESNSNKLLEAFGLIEKQFDANELN